MLISIRTACFGHLRLNGGHAPSNRSLRRSFHSHLRALNQRFSLLTRTSERTEQQGQERNRKFYAEQARNL